MQFGQLLRCKGWPEIVPVRLPQNHQRLLLSFRRQLTVGGSSPQPMHHHGVSQLLHPPQQLAYPALTTPIRSAASRCVIFPSRAASTSPACPVPLGSSRFVPSFSLAAVNRNFLLGPIRNFSRGRDRVCGGVY